MQNAQFSDQHPNALGDLQFYETPEFLADKAFAKFKNKNITRMLDACAGNGALSDAWRRHSEKGHEFRGRHYPGSWHSPRIDAVEIDGNRHPLLRDKGLTIVGFDLLTFEGGEVYSHILVNPPFRNGAPFVLKLWRMLWAGEIVAIINAETLKNPCNQDRRELLRLIEEFGTVEYVQNAFTESRDGKTTDVEVALVHMVKPEAQSLTWVNDLIDGLSRDTTEIKQEFKLPSELALPNSFVKNQCIAFRQAVQAMRTSVQAQCVADQMASRIGQTMAEANGAVGKGVPASVSLRDALTSGYEGLKDRAWTSVLRSTETLSRLSRKVQKQAESRFEQIKTLDFIESNIYGFLLGLVESAGDMQIDMMLDVFDQISEYHTDNATSYRGWVSNTKHRTFGMRIKMSRFVLPHFGFYSSGMEFDSCQRLADFDKVFAMLDGKSIESLEYEQGKPTAEMGMVAALRAHWDDALDAKRIQSKYFDVRFYKGVRTMHFFPRRKDLVDRLNRMVGQRRNWLPPSYHDELKTYFKAFDISEKLDAEIRKEVRQILKEEGRSCSYFDPFSRSQHLTDAERENKARIIALAQDRVLARHGLLDTIEKEEAQVRALIECTAPAAQPAGLLPAPRSAFVQPPQAAANESVVVIDEFEVLEPTGS
ncbi:MAG: DUF4942 domain-containing protein [Polaromonas sp.]|nr:DUF4942 domain-containing protein [Polaromonas sp.]